MTIRDQEKHKMYFPSLCLENFYFDGLGCLWIAALDQPSQSLSELLASLFLIGSSGISSRSVYKLVSALIKMLWCFIIFTFIFLYLQINSNTKTTLLKTCENLYYKRKKNCNRVIIVPRHIHT